MMLHTKFQGHGSIGSGEEDFLRFLPYSGMAAMLVMSMAQRKTRLTLYFSKTGFILNSENLSHPP